MPSVEKSCTQKTANIAISTAKNSEYNKTGMCAGAGRELLAPLANRFRAMPSMGEPIAAKRTLAIKLAFRKIRQHYYAVR